MILFSLAVLEPLLKPDRHRIMSLQVLLRQKIVYVIMHGGFPANKPLPSGRK